jgi:hypothetical protein
MNYNIADTKRIYEGSESSISLSEAELGLLVNGLTTMSGISVQANVLSVVCDLGSRVSLGQVVYHRSKATTEVVEIYGKADEDTSFPWVPLLNVSDSSSVTVDFVSINSKFRLLKVVHTVTVGTSHAYEVEVLTSDEEVGLGSRGDQIETSVDSGTGTLFVEELEIFNKDDEKKRFYAAVNSQIGNRSDLTIGSSMSGPFYGLYENSISLSGTFSWSSGYFDTTQEAGGFVGLVSGTVGAYYTPVIDISSLDSPRLFWTSTISGTTSLDDPNLVDSVPTVAARFSNITPSGVGWVSGELSDDEMWSVVSGTLDFFPVVNDQILQSPLPQFIQIRVDFNSSQDGETPILEKVGVEQPVSVDIDPNTFNTIYLKSNTSENKSGSNAALLIWSYEFGNSEQN